MSTCYKDEMSEWVWHFLITCWRAYGLNKIKPS